MDGDDSEPVEPLAHEDEGQQIDLLRDNSTVREMLSTLGVEYSTKLANVIHMALQGKSIVQNTYKFCLLD